MEISEKELTYFIGEPYLSRGKTYFKEGLIELLKIEDEKVTARAAGSSIYRISLTRKKRKLSGHCSCVAFIEFGPCKHLAATGFALIAHQKSGNQYKPSEEYFERTEAYDKIERKLIRQPKQELVSLILQLTSYHPEIVDTLDEII